MLGAVLLSGCSGGENVAEAEKVESSLSSEENKQQEAIKGLKIALEQSDVVNFSKIAIDAKRNDLLNEEIRDLCNSMINKLLDEKDYKTFRVNYNEISIVNGINEEHKDEYKEILEAETDLRLDEMEVAINNRDFSAVEEIYNEDILIDNTEASAMYAYATYLQTEPKSFEASGDLGLAVNYTYNGRMKSEIYKGVTDTSYISLDNPFVTSFNDFDWEHIEAMYESKKESLAFLEQNKADGEAERAAAVGQNPSIGMTTGQVEVSLWGKPESINRTVTTSSVREQWVYGNGQYLYFEDGILVSFQD